MGGALIQVPHDELHDMEGMLLGFAALEPMLVDSEMLPASALDVRFLFFGQCLKIHLIFSFGLVNFVLLLDFNLVE